MGNTSLFLCMLCDFFFFLVENWTFESLKALEIKFSSFPRVCCLVFDNDGLFLCRGSAKSIHWRPSQVFSDSVPFPGREQSMIRIQPHSVWRAESFAHAPVRTYLPAVSFVCSGTRSCLTLCDPRTVAYPAPLTVGYFQARILEWVAISSSRDLPNPGIKPTSPESSLPPELWLGDEEWAAAAELSWNGCRLTKTYYLNVPLEVASLW